MGNHKGKVNPPQGAGNGPSQLTSGIALGSWAAEEFPAFTWEIKNISELCNARFPWDTQGYYLHRGCHRPEANGHHFLVEELEEGKD